MFKKLLPALVLGVLFGISAGAMILMFQSSQCEKSYSKGSLPELLCPPPPPQIVRHFDEKKPRSRFFYAPPQPHTA